MNLRSKRTSVAATLLSTKRLVGSVGAKSLGLFRIGVLVFGVLVFGVFGVPAIEPGPAFAAKKTTPTTKVQRTLAKAALTNIPEGVVGENSQPATLPSEGATPKPVQAAAARAPWICPVPGAKFTNDYGAPRSGGRSHAGTDMLAPRGTPIVAPIEGNVRHDTSRLGGLSFYLDSPDGLRLFGAHLSAFGAQGQVVAGTVIGFVGDTGNARGTPHLHLEVHSSKKSKINPYPILKEVC